MTCIVGYRDPVLGVHIGADSFSGNAYSRGVVHNSKLVRLNVKRGRGKVPVLLGYTSSWRMGQVLGQIEAPEWKPSVDSFDYLCGPFVNAIRKAFKDTGFARVHENQEEGGVFLVGFADRLFKIQSDYAVLESADQYDACGAGEDFAVGALYALRGLDALHPHERIRFALTAAEAYSPLVASPMRVESVL